MAIYLVFVIIYNDGIMINFCFNQPPHTHSPSFLSPFSLEPNAPSLTHFSVSPSPKKIKKNPLKISVADISSNFNPILSPRITHRPIGSIGALLCSRVSICSSDRLALRLICLMLLCPDLDRRFC